MGLTYPRELGREGGGQERKSTANIHLLPPV